MTTTYREVERKLRVDGLFEIPDLARFCPSVASVEIGAPFVLRATYYDTPDLRLFRWRVTLRRRAGGTDEGWHLKLPVDGADAGTRDELRMPGQGTEVPAELHRIVSALVREAPLQPIVTLRTERAPRILRDADGRARAELVDDRVAVLDVYDTERITMEFREIEVEALADSSGQPDESMLDEVVGGTHRARRSAVPHEQGGHRPRPAYSRAPGHPGSDLAGPPRSGHRSSPRIPLPARAAADPSGRARTP